MKLFKKNHKLEEVKMDENGNVINPEPKSGKGKGMLKKVAIGLIGLAGGAIAFCAVGVAMAAAGGDSSDTNTGDEVIENGSDSTDSSEGTGTEATGTSEE